MSDHSQNGQISWTMRALIALVFILGISVLVLVARQSRPANPDPEAQIQVSEEDPARVMVYGEPIRNQHIKLAMSQWNSEQPGAVTLSEEQVLERLIQQRLLVKLAQDLGVDEAPMTLTRLQFTNHQILAEDATKTFLSTAVSEDDILEYYETERKIRADQTQIRARQIVTPDLATAKEINRRLDNGDAFATLALAFSLDRASRESGGDLGYINYDMLDPLLSEKIFAASDGSRLEPFETSQGWHVVEVMSRRKAPIPSLDDRREAIVALLKANALKARLRDLRQNANIQILQD